jgi:3-oxocholest-4-en-26-oate---CoA ligase
VHDAAVVGMPHPRFGEAVNALVQLEEGATFDEAALIAHVKAMRAHYKVPKRIVPVPSTNRAANGKLDYKALRAMLESALG